MKDKENHFIELIKLHEGIIFKVIAVYAPKHLHEKDWYQEIVLQLWKAFENYAATAKPSTWIYRIAFNTMVSEFRRGERRVKEQSLDYLSLDIPNNQEKKAAIEGAINQLYKQIEQLSPIEKAIVLLYLEEKSYEDIAEITGLSVTNVGSRLSRIRKKLKERIKT